MRVVAIRTGNQLLVDSVPVWLGEIRSRFRVAAVAERWLVIEQQRILLMRVVRRVAIDTTDAIFEML